jgi:thiaminase
MTAIETSGLILQISEYGILVRQYHDTDYTRFMEESKRIIDQHLSKYAKQKVEEVKNIKIHIYTY